MAAWLSQKRSVGEEIETPKSLSNWVSKGSLVVATSAWYSASTEDCEIVVCFPRDQRVS